VLEVVALGVRNVTSQKAAFRGHENCSSPSSWSSPASATQSVRDTELLPTPELSVLGGEMAPTACTAGPVCSVDPKCRRNCQPLPLDQLTLAGGGQSPGAQDPLKTVSYAVRRLSLSTVRCASQDFEGEGVIGDFMQTGVLKSRTSRWRYSRISSRPSGSLECFEATRQRHDRVLPNVEQ